MRAWSDIIKDLRADLDLSRVQTRKVAGTVIPYLEGDDVINTANRIFDEDGWDALPLAAVQRFEVGTKQTDSGPILLFVYHVPYMTRFHGFLADGSVHTIEKGDIGKNSTQSEAFQQHEMAISGCATDALKRCMRHLGRQFGITLYDTEHEDFLAATGKKPKKEVKKAPVKKAPVKKKGTKEQQTVEGTGPVEKPEPEQVTEQEVIKAEDTARVAPGEITLADDPMSRALSYTIPEELSVNGKTVRLPSAGKTVETVLGEPLGVDLLTWLGGLRVSPAKSPPFVAETEEETRLQNAVRFVLLNKMGDDLSDEETKTIKESLSV
ncbi:MAG: Rad52/Rad22 family DNA repair protein [Nitrosopumilus sp.]